MPAPAWDALMGELDTWAGAGRTATFWWRDDDAADHTPALDRLLALRDAVDVPLALAVIPARATPALRDRLASAPGLATVQHGYSHKSFATGADRPIELDGSRPAEYVISDLAVGAQSLARLASHVPVLVPPWNRIAPHLVPLLPEIGFQGLSTIGARAREFPVRGLRQQNVHLDVIDWRGKKTGIARGFLGADNIIADTIRHLAARRAGAVETNRAVPDEATGLMTHHSDMDDAMFGFVREFVIRTRAHPAVVWQSANEVFSVP